MKTMMSALAALALVAPRQMSKPMKPDLATRFGLPARRMPK
jgi:hypothetical protein